LARDPIEQARDNWRAKGWPEAAPGMAVLTSVVRVNQIYVARVEAILRPFGLTFARYEALMLLLFSRAGRLPLGKMGERLQVHPASVTNAIDRLERDGLVQREPHPTDGRGILALLTPAGRKLAEAASARLNAEVFDDVGLADAELSQLFSLLKEVRRRDGDFS
jgi:DNA-binding MarR family transcriptional regulator